MILGRFLSILLLAGSASAAFYLPGVNPNTFKPGDQVQQPRYNRLFIEVCILGIVKGE